MLKEVDALLGAVQRTAWELRALGDDLMATGEQVIAWRRRSIRFAKASLTLGALTADYRAFAIYSAFVGVDTRARLRDQIHARSAARFHKTSVEVQGAFLKVGQLLSARPDLLPPAWISTLAPLQDAAPPEPFASIRALVETELGPLSERFARFDEAPIAAASIGQVHRALTLDGVEVAVKVQRPDIAVRVEDDLALLGLFLESVRGLLPPTDLDTIRDEIEAMLRGELDYLAEAAAMAALGDFFAGTPGVIVPRPLPALSSAHVLTCTFQPGDKITLALDRAVAAGDRATVSNLLGTLLEVYLRQILERGLFQADPHPGNFLCTPEGELVLLDFGCTRALPQAMRTGLGALVRAAMTDDRAALAEQLLQLGFATRSGAPDTLVAFAGALLAAFRAGAHTGTFCWPDKQTLLGHAAALLAQSERDPVVRIPADFVMVGRVLATLGGLFSHYRPDIDHATRVVPHVLRAAFASPADPAQ